MHNMIVRRQRSAGIVLVVVLTAVASIGVQGILRSILRAAGWALIVDERVEPADVIVVAVDADGAGVLVAAGLVHSGVARRVAVFADPPDTMVEREFIRRGIPLRRRGRAIRSTALGKRAGTPISSNDVWIAALCRQHSFFLLSRDRHFDLVGGIDRIDW